MTTTKASVLFVCVHNAGRSQMAAGFLQHLAGDRVEVRSAGTAPGVKVNPSAVKAMAELGIDISQNFPKKLTDEAVKDSDYVITMVSKLKCFETKTMFLRNKTNFCETKQKKCSMVFHETKICFATF